MKRLLLSAFFGLSLLQLLLPLAVQAQEDHPAAFEEHGDRQSPSSASSPAQSLTLKTKTCEARFENGGLSFLLHGELECVKGDTASPSSISFEGKWSFASQHQLKGSVLTGSFTQDSIPGAKLTTTWNVDERNGDIVLRQEASSPLGGLEALRWDIGKVPLDWTAIAPCGGGMRFSKDSPDSGMSADGPMFWELPLLILQSPQGGGFYVMSEDREWPFYSFRIKRGAQGFDISIITWNVKPFKDKRTCRSMNWIVNAFDGDWRVPAKRMRDFFEKELGAKANFDSNPAWVKDIDCVLFDEKMDSKRIDWLLDSHVIEPSRTMVYLSHWRKQDFDRGYPDYGSPSEKALKFIRSLKGKGFRVALHTNWFCCDPRDELYKRVESFTIKNPDGSVKGYLNPRKDPPIESRYINPAAPEWRQEFVRRMKEMIALTGADCIHLDQNFHCHNYDGTQIGDMSMIEGDLAFHRELRQALPDVALAGEGLNGLTARYLAFAQRHVWSLLPQVIDRRDLEKYHPVSSYIFSPTTRIYGWLGTGDPAQRDGQLYAAWREGLAHMGAMPAFRTLFLTDKAQVESPQGFRRTEFDEIAFWQKNRLRPDLEGPWPKDVLFPFVSEDGKIRAARMADGSLRTSDRLISRAVAGESKLSGPGSIGGNFYYDSNAIYGLNPELWHPFFEEARDLNAFHLESLPKGLIAAGLKEDEKSIRFEILPCGQRLASMVQSLPTARRGCLLKGEDGSFQEVLRNEDFDDIKNGMVKASGKSLFMRPPGRPSGTKLYNESQFAGAGQAFVSYRISVPAGLRSRFVSNVYMHGDSLGQGRSDGADFSAEAECDADHRKSDAKLFFDARGLGMDGNIPKRIVLDLTPFAGSEITLALSAGPGPYGNATKDNAIWLDPRIESFFSGVGRMTAVIPFQPSGIDIAGRHARIVSSNGASFVIEAEMPGPVEILKQP